MDDTENMEDMDKIFTNDYNIVKFNIAAHSSSGLGHSPLTAETGVRVPYALPY